MKRIVCSLLAAVMVLSLTACGSTFEWPDTAIAGTLPTPASNAGEIGNNSNDYFTVTVEEASLSDYNTYLDACKEKGYTIEADESGNSYTAFNQDGYHLSLDYRDYSEEIHISVYAPKEFGELKWPTGGLAKMLPAVSSTVGDIRWDDEDSFAVQIGNMSYEEYGTYVAACEKKGFTVDYSKDEDTYFASNAEGYKIGLYYQGFNTVEISIKAPESATTTTTASTTTTTAAAAEGVSADFKAMLDSYEAFMDRYISFMERYKNSDDVVGMMGEYTEIMSEYTNYVSKINAVDTSSLTAADYAYYVQVTGRVAQKLLAVQ